MRITEGVNEFTGFEARDLRHHHGEQGIGGDVERYAEEDISRALVELAREFSVRHIKLEKGVTGRQGHLVDNAGVVGDYEQAAAVGVGFDLVDQI